MKKKLFKNAVASILLLVISFSTYSQPNIIPNSNIEDGSSSPSYWSHYISSGTMECSWDTAQAVSGSHSLKIEATTDGTGQWYQLLSETIDDSVIYRFRVHLYATNTNTGASGAELHWYNSSNAYLGRTSLSPTISNQWQELENNTVIPPQDATKVYVVLRAYKAGVYYLDDPVLMRKNNNLHTLAGKFPIGLYYMPSYELIKNGNVEKYLTYNTQTPQAWTPGYSSNSWDSSLAYSGTRSLKLTLSSDGIADWRQLVTNIKDSDEFCLKAFIYATNVSSDSHAIELQWFDASYTYLGRNVYSANTAGNWVSIDENGIIPPSGATQVWVLTRAYKTGTYNFDDLSLSIDQTNAEKLQRLKNAGFNFLMSTGLLGEMNSISGFYGVVNADTTSATLSTLINQYEAENALRIWHASPDEPAWQVPIISSSAMANGYNTILSNDDYYYSTPHKVWINHAPRGTRTNPSDFSILRTFRDGADIVSMDIYPAGGCWHINLENLTISCVGEYTKILYDNAATDSSGLQDKPIWMVLQGAGHTDLTRITHSVELHWVDSSFNLKRADRFYINTTGSWQDIDAAGIIPPADAVTVSVQLRGYGPGEYYFDDVSLLESGITNKLQNSNFEIEAGGTGLPYAWTPIGTSTWNSSFYTSSNHSVKAQVTANDFSCWYQNVSIDSSKTYDLFAKIRSSVAGEYPRPTWLQTRFMAYDAIINGARGIVYYGCQTISCNTALWEDIERIAGELNDLSNTLTNQESFRSVTSSSSSIEFLLFDVPGGLCLIAANTTAQPVSSVNIQISGLPLSQIMEYYSSIPETISNNSFSKSFGAYEVKIWNIE